jgi:SsrA-binding protein
MPDDGQPIIRNRKARFDYHVEETVEAGIALAGCEVKSIRSGNVQLRDGYARIEGGEAWLHEVHVTPYAWSHHESVLPRRKRKLLLTRREILRLDRLTREKGLTLIPLSIYFHRGHAKVELGLCRGKRQYDKKEALAERDAKRAMEHEASERN